MKTRSLFCLALLVGYVLLTTSVFPQGTKAAGEPVEGAEIFVEQVHQNPRMKAVEGTGGEMEIVGLGFEKRRCKSNEKGEFSFSLPNDQFRKLPEEFHLRFTIKPKDPGRFPAETNSVVLKAKKADGPKFDFIVTFQPSKVKTNKGTFAVNRSIPPRSIASWLCGALGGHPCPP